ncbi:MAG: UvrD-helicase domain-containing protein [Nitriliruptoraceae bacterium]
MSAVPSFAADGALPEASLALEASAGTGKTWTLTSLTVRYVDEGVDELPELLLVTFTRAATAELRDRVRRRLAEVLEATERAQRDPAAWRATGRDAVLDRIVGDAVAAADPAAELATRAERLRVATGQLDEATISTIHGFCQAMLHHAALEAGVDFDAVLLEDDADLLEEIVDDHLALELRSADPAWIRYLQDTASVGRDRLTRLAREVAALPTLQLRPELPERSGADWQPWRDALATFQARWQDVGAEHTRALIAALCADGAFASTRQRTYTEKRAVAQAAAIEDWLRVPHPYPPGPLEQGKLHTQAEHPYAYLSKRSMAPFLRDDARLPDDPLLAAADALVAEVTTPATRFLHRSARRFWQELEARKRQRTVVTFDDLLRRLAAALQAPGTRVAIHAAIRQRFRVALIDEFQDTDPVQWRIFSSLFDAEEPFILIGDPKQAIYGFRGADLHTYVRARDTRPELATLATNHRSDHDYVAACNHLFGQRDAFATDDIPYHDITAHHGDRLHDPAGRAALQLRIIDRAAGEVTTPRGRPGLLKKGWADRALPGDVAAVAVELLTGGLTLPDEQPQGPIDATTEVSGTASGTDDPSEAPGGGARRGLVPEDLAVLVRTNRRALAVQRALHEAGVPAVIQRGGSVYETAEAEALTRLLAAMLRPSSQRDAVAAAATPLFGRSASELAAQLAALDDAAAGTSAPQAGEGPSAVGRWEAWVDALTRWGELWQRRGILAAVQSALVEDGVAARLLAADDGDRRLTNVRHLLELLHEEEATSHGAGHTLLEWLRARRAAAADGEQASADTELRLEQDAEAVRIVTIHGSKGLQYPVVLCPDLWDGRDRTDERLTRYHEPGVDDPGAAITLDIDVDTASPAKQRSIALARWEARTEQLRLAYVALTRAQHRCVVWWGGFTDASTSALASLLHGHAVDPDGDRGSGDGAATAAWLERIAAHVAGSDDEQLVREVEELAEGAGGSIDVEVVHTVGAGASWTSPERDRAPLAARTSTRHLDRSWRRTSFSALVRDAAAHGAPPTGPEASATAPQVLADDGRDVDAEVEGLDATLAGSALAGAMGGGGADEVHHDLEVPLARFPRGAGPGTFLHDVLEHLDFRRVEQPGHLDAVIAPQEQRHGIDPGSRPMVRTGLTSALTTPLGAIGGGARLIDLAETDRLDELRFELPIAGGRDPHGTAFSLHEVADLLTTSDDPLIASYAGRLREPSLAPGVRGFLTGSIDLLARLPDGRFLVADYKSNWFGDRSTERSVPADYRPAQLDEAMLGHHYVLQGLLYLVAAHRYLRWRLPGYDYDTHLVGAGYLFLRGMVGLPDARTGIAVLRPAGSLIEQLSAMVDGGRR